MVNLHYTPQQVGQMTLVQCLCLGREEPPRAERIESAGDFLAVLKKQEEEEKAWESGDKAWKAKDEKNEKGEG